MSYVSKGVQSLKATVLIRLEKTARGLGLRRCQICTIRSPSPFKAATGSGTRKEEQQWWERDALEQQFPNGAPWCSHRAEIMQEEAKGGPCECEGYCGELKITALEVGRRLPWGTDATTHTRWRWCTGKVHGKVCTGQFTVYSSRQQARHMRAAVIVDLSFWTCMNFKDERQTT